MIANAILTSIAPTYRPPKDNRRITGFAEREGSTVWKALGANKITRAAVLPPSGLHIRVQSNAVKKGTAKEVADEVRELKQVAYHIFAALGEKEGTDGHAWIDFHIEWKVNTKMHESVVT